MLAAARLLSEARTAAAAFVLTADNESLEKAFAPQSRHIPAVCCVQLDLWLDPAHDTRTTWRRAGIAPRSCWSVMSDTAPALTSGPSVRAPSLGGRQSAVGAPDSHVCAVTSRYLRRPASDSRLLACHHMPTRVPFYEDCYVGSYEAACWSTLVRTLC